MPYMNYTQGAGGGSEMEIGPGAGGPGGNVPGGGGDGAFLQMLAMAREDKLRKQREAEATNRREMLLREGQSRQTERAEIGRRGVANRELSGREMESFNQRLAGEAARDISERGDAQRMALEGAGMRSRLGLEEEQRKEMVAQREAASSRVPMREVSGPGAQYMHGKLARPNELTARQRQAHGFSGYNIPPAGG